MNMLLPLTTEASNAPDEPNRSAPDNQLAGIGNQNDNMRIKTQNV